MGKNIAKIKVSLKDAFKMWLELTRVFNKLTNKEITFLSTFLYHRYFISKEVKSELYLNKILFGQEMRKQLREELEISPQVFLNITSNLRKKNVFKNNTINKMFIPNIDDSGQFRVIFDIHITNDKG